MNLESLIACISIVVLHFVADFLFQDEKWAVNKSHSIKALTLHVTMYTSIWFLFCNFYCIATGNYKMFFLVPITFILHWIVDYFTSKVTSRLYAEKKFGSSTPNLGFFSMIGFDQVLHYTQLFLTFYFLS